MARRSDIKDKEGTHTENYNAILSFELPDAYKMIWKEKADGSKECEIVFGEYTDANGKTVYDFMATVGDTIIESIDEDPIPPGEKPFDTFHRRDQVHRYYQWSSEPEAELEIRETPINVLGRQFKYYALMLVIQVSENKLTSIIRMSEWDEEEPGKNIETYRHMLRIVEAVRYMGEPLVPLAMTEDQLIKLWEPDFNSKSAVRDIDLHIKWKDAKGETLHESTLKRDVEEIIHAEDVLHTDQDVDGEYADYEIKDRIIQVTNKNVTKVEIPDGVTAIGTGAFRDCNNLTEVVVPDSVVEIGCEAFSNCEKLTKINIPESVLIINSSAFWYCTALSEIELPDGLKKIDEKAFIGCKNLKSITIPETVTSIGAFAFFKCSELKSIIIPKAVEEIGDVAFMHCESLSQVVFFEGAGIERLNNGTFVDCSSLTSIILPSSIKALKHGVFSECTSLRKIDISNVNELDDEVFEGCEKLEEIVFSNSLEVIPYGLCRGCSSLKTIRIPDSVKLIDSFAFENTALKNVVLPSRAEVREDAFDDGVEVSYRNGNDQTEEKKLDDSTSILEEEAVQSKETVGKYTVVHPSDELYSHYGMLKREADRMKLMGGIHAQNNGEEFQALNILEILSQRGQKKKGIYRKLKAALSADNYDLDELAMTVSQIFRVNESVFNSRHDDEGDINSCLMDKKWKFSALRSFAWTLADLADREGKSIDDYEYDDLIAVCNFIENREWLNYEGGSWFDGLCGHPDIHVLYMPEKLIENGEAEDVYQVMNFNPIVSLDAFRADLICLRNVMIKIHNGILKSRDRNKKLDSPAAAVLQAWCVMAMSAKIAFFSEDGPMVFYHSYPSDSLNTVALNVGDKVKTSLPKAPSKLGQTEVHFDVGNTAEYKIVQGDDGKERIILGEYPKGSPIVWLVLGKEGEELLLISEAALDNKPFCQFRFDAKQSHEWYACTLRTWLNEEFYKEAFSENERNMILEDTHDTYKRLVSEEETPSVIDKVFLLSEKEVSKYFPQKKDRVCKATAYAKENGVTIERGPNQCSWWLRSPAVAMMGTPLYASIIRTDASCVGWGVGSYEIGVRPVIRVKRRILSTSRSSTAKPINSNIESNDLQKAQETFDDLHSEVKTTLSVIETFDENVRGQREKMRLRIEEARNGKLQNNESDMLVILLIEEHFGTIDSDDDEFVATYAEDFPACDEKQLIQLRNKVKPTIHDAVTIESVKSNMLARTLEERFLISTRNCFLVNPGWNDDERGKDAIAATQQWYRPEEIAELTKRMEDFIEENRKNLNNQISKLRPEWSDFEKSRSDLHIKISINDDPVAKNFDLFHVKMHRDLDIYILLSNPSLKYVSVPVKNITASCWGVSPEDIWNAALENSIDDRRGLSSSSRSDALAAKELALSQIRLPLNIVETSSVETVYSQLQVKDAEPVNPKVIGIKQLEESLAALQAELDNW